MSELHPSVDDVVQDKTLRRALNYVSVESRNWVLDSLACHFHNEGHGLAGNLERGDARWLAAEIFRQRNPCKHCNALEREPEPVQAEYLAFANAALKSLPALTERIAQRYITAAAAMRSQEQIYRARKDRMKGK